MRILELHLHTSQLEALRRFYTDTLGLALVASEADRFEVQAGASRLAFRSVTRGRPFYHFAFNIPAGALPTAKRFLHSRVELLTEDGADEFNSSLLQSRQVYFLDPAGNIGEFISPDSEAPQSATFTIGDIIGISEIGLSTPTFAATVAQICTDFGVAPVREPSEDFGALGTLAGRFIIVSEGRHWFPTATGAEIHPFEALVKLHRAQLPVPWPALCRDIGIRPKGLRVHRGFCPLAQARLFDFPDRSLGGSTEFFLPIRINDKDVALAHRLVLAAAGNTSAGNQPCAFGRAQIIDLELKCQAIAQHGAAGICQSIVGQVADHAAMGEAMLLQVFRLELQGEFGLARFKSDELRPDEDAEWLRGQHLAAEGEQIGHRWSPIYCQILRRLSCYRVCLDCGPVTVDGARAATTAGPSLTRKDLSHAARGAALSIGCWERKPTASRFQVLMMPISRVS